MIRSIWWYCQLHTITNIIQSKSIILRRSNFLFNKWYNPQLAITQWQRSWPIVSRSVVTKSLDTITHWWSDLSAQFSTKRSNPSLQSLTIYGTIISQWWPKPPIISRWWPKPPLPSSPPPSPASPHSSVRDKSIQQLTIWEVGPFDHLTISDEPGGWARHFRSGHPGQPPAAIMSRFLPKLFLGRARNRY